MSEREFLRRWDGSFESVVTLQLQTDQQDDAVLVPLSRHAKASLLLIEHIERSNESNTRCTAASLSGLLASKAPNDLLERLFDAECSRLSNGHDPLKVIGGQSVVEELLFAAARWCRDPQAKDAGLSLCRKIVERTITFADSEYWNAVSYAMVTLVHHAAPDANSLLARFTTWANGVPPEYVTRPTLQNEQGCARALGAHNPNAVGRVDALIDRRDARPPADFGGAFREQLDEWLALAAEIG